MATYGGAETGVGSSPTWKPQMAGGSMTGGGPAPTAGGGGGGAMASFSPAMGSGAGTLYGFKTGGYGTMPESASPLSQAWQGQASNARWNQMRLAGGGDAGRGAEQMAESANLGYQQQQQEFQRGMQDQQLQGAMLKNQALSKLMALFGGGGGGENPAEGFLAGLRSGGVQGLADSPLMQKLLAGHQAQVTSAFEDPGGLRSQTQRLGAQQNRYSSDSVMGAQRQAALEKQRGIAGSQAYGKAWEGTLAGMDPLMKSAGLTTQFAQSQQGQLPQLLSAVMRG